MFRKRTKKERLWEIFPGALTWAVFFGAAALSYFQPIWAAIFIICFDTYFLAKSAIYTIHTVNAYGIFKASMQIDWLAWTEKLPDLKSFMDFLGQEARPGKSKKIQRFVGNEIARLKKFQTYLLTESQPRNFDFKEIYQLVLIPFVDEAEGLLRSTIKSIVACQYPKDKMIILLAAEARAGEEARRIALQMQTEFGNSFYKFFVSFHPDNLEGEIKGKSANATFAVNHILPELKNLGISPDKTIISNFDSDTQPHPQYFARAAYMFLTAEKPHQISMQPLTFYHNNIWESPSISRVISANHAFWVFSESSREKRMRTFSSHSMSLKTLVDVGLWDRQIVNEDGYIFWQCLFHYNGDYKVLPMHLPVSMDTCLGDTWKQTLINQYKQVRRWAYFVEYYPHLMPKLFKNPMPIKDKLYHLFNFVENHLNWATASIIIATMGWLPIILGGARFGGSVTAFNLPKVTQTLMNVTMSFLIIGVYLNYRLLPKEIRDQTMLKRLAMFVQWLLVPFIAVAFISVPAIDAQTRLMFGKYLEFWVTPKARKKASIKLEINEIKTVEARSKY